MVTALPCSRGHGVPGRLLLLEADEKSPGRFSVSGLASRGNNRDGSRNVRTSQG
jgi:hypothetical protein